MYFFQTLFHLETRAQERLHKNLSTISSNAIAHLCENKLYFTNYQKQDEVAIGYTFKKFT